MCVCVLRRFGHVRLCDSMDCSLPGPSVRGILQARELLHNTGVVCPCPSPGDLPAKGSNSPLLRLVLCQVDSLPLIPPGKPLKLIPNLKFTLKLVRKFIVIFVLSVSPEVLKHCNSLHSSPTPKIFNLWSVIETS